MITVNELREKAKAIRGLATLADRQASKGLIFEAEATLRKVKESAQETISKMEDRK